MGLEVIIFRPRSSEVWESRWRAILSSGRVAPSLWEYWRWKWFRAAQHAVFCCWWASRTRLGEVERTKSLNIRTLIYGFTLPFMLNYGNDTLHRRSLLEWFNETAIYPNGCGLLSHIMLLKEIMQEVSEYFPQKPSHYPNLLPFHQKSYFRLSVP